MNLKTAVGLNLLFLFAAQLFSTQAFADCSAACERELSSCQSGATSPEQKNRCSEQSAICGLNCNRDQTMYCTYLGFKDHDGVADKDQELKEVTGAFARITSDGRPHFGGLCSSNNLKCDHVLGWDRKMYYCGGEVREPRRVACCR